MELTKPTIIQLLGQARAGKDFTAQSLKEYYISKGYTVEIKSYAAPMKRIAATLFGVTLKQLDDLKNDTTNSPILVCNSLRLLLGEPYDEHITSKLNMRTFLQRLGNEAMKSEFGNSVWADLMKSQIDKSSADIIIIPDCRFTTELQTFPTSITVRVINSSLEPPMDHASELELLDYSVDFTIDNTDYKLTSEEIIHLAESVLKGPHNGD